MGAFQDWLVEINTTPLTVDKGVNGLEHEAQSNQWSFSFVQEQIEELSANEVTAFLDAVVGIYNSRLNKSSCGSQMIFYCWFDPQAIQLRFSLASSSHGSLPFGCSVKALDSSTQIVEQLLSSRYYNGIPLTEFTQNNYSEQDATSGDALKVWVRELPILAPRPSGLAEGQFVVPDDFDDPLPDEIQRLFDGR